MHDVRGLPITAASTTAVDAYEQALASFLNYEAAAGGLLKSVIVDHPQLPMASILRGYMTMMVESTAIHGRANKVAVDLLANRGQLNSREIAHAEALGVWSSADPAGAAAIWGRILAEYPLDLLALKMHHYTTFWRGRPASLRSTVEATLPWWDRETPGYDHVLGMHAFALNETGRFEQAETVGRSAVEQNPEDLWSVHAVAHALEMQGHIERGVSWFQDKLGSWDSKNPFRGHLWWHAILFPYAGGNYEEVLRLYDTCLVPLSSDFFLDIQNRASILARLELADVGVGDRWNELAEFSANRIGDHVLAFTDLHCCLALAASDSESELSQFVQSMQSHQQKLQASNCESIGYQTATKLALGIEQWAKGASTAETGSDAGETLWLLQDELAPIGGSHAQQSLFQQLIAKITSDSASAELSRSLLTARHGAFPNHIPTIDSLIGALSTTAVNAKSTNFNSEALVERLKAKRSSIRLLNTNYDIPTTT